MTVKIIKFLRTAICLPLLALASCRPSTKPVFKVPPSLQPGYIDGGGTLRWPPTGERFQVFWYGTNPCLESDNLVSDGTTAVTCHVDNVGVNGGSYRYTVGKPDPHAAK